MSYPIKYPFTLTKHNQVGLIESETHFEGVATYFHDEDTEMQDWEVVAYVTGFTQYRNGQVLTSVTGLKSNDWKVADLESFEAACVERALFQYELKMTKKAA